MSVGSIITLLRLLPLFCPSYSPNITRTWPDFILWPQTSMGSWHSSAIGFHWLIQDPLSETRFYAFFFLLSIFNTNCFPSSCSDDDLLLISPPYSSFKNLFHFLPVLCSKVRRLWWWQGGGSDRQQLLSTGSSCNWESLMQIAEWKSRPSAPFSAVAAPLSPTVLKGPLSSTFAPAFVVFSFQVKYF